MVMTSRDCCSAREMKSVCCCRHSSREKVVEFWEMVQRLMNEPESFSVFRYQSRSSYALPRPAALTAREARQTTASITYTGEPGLGTGASKMPAHTTKTPMAVPPAA